MRRNSDDDEDPFDQFGGMEDIVSEMTGGEAGHVDVHEYDDHITVVADIPGVEEEDIDLKCDGRTLLIRASTDARPYAQRVNLPGYVDEQSASASYNNGILEVTLERGNDPANIGFQ